MLKITRAQKYNTELNNKVMFRIHIADVKANNNNSPPISHSKDERFRKKN